MDKDRYDAVIIGSGPNGLSAAIRLAQAGCATLTLEAAETIGGGVRSKELTLPGFVHDPCAAIFPLSLASPFLRALPLEQYGLRWGHSPLAVAHPLDGGQAALVERSLEATAHHLGRCDPADGRAYERLMRPLLEHWDAFSRDLIGPLPIPPRDRLTFIRFGLRAWAPAGALGRRLFRGPAARAMFAGMAAHSMLPFSALGSGAFGIVLGLTAHAVGWPFPLGGAGQVTQALAAHLRALGGEIAVNCEVKDLADLPPAKVYLFDVTPRQLLHIVGQRFPPGYRRALSRYRYGVGVFKLDYALDGPVPWAAEAATQAATLHLGGSLDEIETAENAVAGGQHPARPYVLAAQPSLFDPSRAPAGAHTLWAYCHVPHGSTVDMTQAIEDQIERFAPGFRRRILARSVRRPAGFEAYNPNYIGGDINGGRQDVLQLYTRPTLRLNPYTTPLNNVFICSSSTPPGGGVHGMCGYYAAEAALRRLGG